MDYEGRVSKGKTNRYSGGVSSLDTIYLRDIATNRAGM
jgi:hypothetical protein